MKNFFKNFLIFVFIFLILATLLSFFTGQNKKPENIGMNDFVALINDEKISEITVIGDQVDISLTSGEKKEFKKESGESLTTLFSNLAVSPEKISKVKILVKDDESFSSLLLSWLPFIVPFILVIIFLYLLDCLFSI